MQSGADQGRIKLCIHVCDQCGRLCRRLAYTWQLESNRRLRPTTICSREQPLPPWHSTQQGLCRPAFNMLAPPAISLPLDPAMRADSPALSTPQELSAPPRFPHTRAQLTAIARQYRPLDNYDEEGDDDSGRVSSALVARVASLLDAEHEEELKNLLRDSFGPSIDDDDEVCSRTPFSVRESAQLPSPSSPSMS